MEIKIVDCERSKLKTVLENDISSGWKLLQIIYLGEHTSEKYNYKMFTIIYEKKVNINSMLRDNG